MINILSPYEHLEYPNKIIRSLCVTNVVIAVISYRLIPDHEPCTGL